MNETNSLSRMLGILDLFSEQHPEWTPEELLGRLGYSRPTLYRYLKTLKQAGLIVSINQSYTLGPRIVEMDFLLRRSDPLVLHGRHLIENLTERYVCAALLVRWYGSKILCVDSVRSDVNVPSSYPRGRPMPLGRGAIARAIIASLPRRQLLPIVERQMAEFRAIGLGQTVQEVLERLKKVRKAGFSLAHGEVTPGVVGIASPVFDAGQAPIASVCITISGQSVSGQDIERICQDVRACAATLSTALATHRANNGDDGKKPYKSHKMRLLVD